MITVKQSGYLANTIDILCAMKSLLLTFGIKQEYGGGDDGSTQTERDKICTPNPLPTIIMLLTMPSYQVVSAYGSSTLLDVFFSYPVTIPSANASFQSVD